VDPAANGKCTENFETKASLGKDWLQFLTNCAMFSPEQVKDYRSQIDSYKPKN